MAQDNVVPQEIKNTLDAVVLIGGGITGLGSLASLGIATLETGDPLQAISDEFGVTKLVEGVERAESAVNGMEEMMK